MRAERFEIEEISGYKHLSLQEAQRAALPRLAEFIACMCTFGRASGPLS